MSLAYTSSSGIKRIAKERQRQIDEEGWTPEHDDEHGNGEMALAAICYASPQPVFTALINPLEGTFHFEDPWPWARHWDKRPYDEEAESLTDPFQWPDAVRVRCLEKAGALIAAEIDRLLREEPVS